MNALIIPFMKHRDALHRIYTCDVLDPDTKEVVHTVTHPVMARSTRDAEHEIKRAYGFHDSWKIKARLDVH